MTNPNPDISPKPLRILALEVKDVKRISYVEIAPKSRLVGIFGKNGAGKTTLLDSIMWALGGARTIQLQPIRKGQEKAYVKLAVGSETIEFIVTRIFKEGKKPELIVESATGAQYPKPQEFINTLFGAISLDPQEFIRMEAGKRVELLKRIVHLDVDLEELDRQNKGDFTRRTDVNRDVERLKQQVSLYAGGVKMDMDVNPIDTNALVAEMSKASEHNAAIHRETQRREQDLQYLRTHQADLTGIDAEIQRLVEKREALARDIGTLIQKIESAPALDTMIDVTDLGEQIKRAQSENSMRQLQRNARERYETTKKELEGEVVKRDALTAQMEARTDRKNAALANAKYPVPGLSFTEDGGVFFDGVPFEQASMAQQIRVSFGIAAAMKPRMPVVLIRDGALLDDDSIALLEEEAEKYGAQVWIERQKVTEGERGDVIVLQEGEIVETK